MHLIHKSEQGFGGLRSELFLTLMQLSCLCVLDRVHLARLAFDGILHVFQVSNSCVN